jgi:hypothetical protein
MLRAMATPPPAAAPRPARRSIAGFFLRLVFKGKRAFVTVPLLLGGAGLGYLVLDYRWYRGISEGERTGVIIKVSRKGTPLCRYESVEMRVGQQTGAALLGSETWEFTVDDEHRGLIPRLEEAERKQAPITVKYRQDSKAMDVKPVPPPNNLPWRYCVATSYHAVDIVSK